MEYATPLNSNMNVTVWLPLKDVTGKQTLSITNKARLEGATRDGVTYVILFILFDVLVLEKILGFSILHYVVLKITTWVIALISLGT